MIKLGDSAVWSPPNLPTWMASKIEAPKWLLDGMLPADSIVLVSGQPKLSKKTWLVLAQALLVASGKEVGPFKPVNPEGEAVLVLEAEGAASFTRERWLKLGVGLGIDVAAQQKLFFAHRHQIMLDDPSWAKNVRDFVVANNVKMVVIDPLAQHMRGEENSVKDVSAFLRNLISVREKGASIVLIHHTGKPSKDFVKDPDHELRGSTAIPGSYETHYAIRGRKQDAPHTDLLIRSKDAEDRRFDIRWFIDASKATFTITPVDANYGKAVMRDDLLDAMMPGESYSRARMREILSVSHEELEKILAEMCSDGTLQKTAKGYCLANVVPFAQ